MCKLSVMSILNKELHVIPKVTRARLYTSTWQLTETLLDIENKDLICYD